MLPMEQQVSQYKELHFRVVYFPEKADLKTTDPLILELMLYQIHFNVLSGEYQTQMEQAIALAAYKCVVELNQFDPFKHKLGLLSKVMKHYLPKQYIS